MYQCACEVVLIKEPSLTSLCFTRCSPVAYALPGSGGSPFKQLWFGLFGIFLLLFMTFGYFWLLFTYDRRVKKLHLPSPSIPTVPELRIQIIPMIHTGGESWLYYSQLEWKVCLNQTEVSLWALMQRTVSITSDEGLWQRLQVNHFKMYLRSEKKLFSMWINPVFLFCKWRDRKSVV